MQSSPAVKAQGAELLRVIVRVSEPAKVVRFQSLLVGEGHLACMRCLSEDHLVQELWTTEAQRDDVYAWLESLPSSLGVTVLEEIHWTQT